MKQKTGFLYCIGSCRVKYYSVLDQFSSNKHIRSFSVVRCIFLSTRISLNGFNVSELKRF